eukprot:TRINITY_DN4963_c0_g1_i2.p1 TRINITY_DN4963_c0_g1~~TRINITY_DN4963_c0_g1_i2.p1  ORF type:complete len:532 (-),score=93.38 TRINITY_DN4963_c0_g1_i2:79-1674(-)
MERIRLALEEVFAKLDADGKGVVDQQTFIRMIPALFPSWTGAEAKATLEASGALKEGRVEYRALLEFMCLESADVKPPPSRAVPGIGKSKSLSLSPGAGTRQARILGEPPDATRRLKTASGPGRPVAGNQEAPPLSAGSAGGAVGSTAGPPSADAPAAAAAPRPRPRVASGSGTPRNASQPAVAGTPRNASQPAVAGSSAASPTSSCRGGSGHLPPGRISGGGPPPQHGAWAPAASSPAPVPLSARRPLVPTTNGSRPAPIAGAYEALSKKSLLGRVQSPDMGGAGAKAQIRRESAPHLLASRKEQMSQAEPEPEEQRPADTSTATVSSSRGAHGTSPTSSLRSAYSPRVLSPRDRGASEPHPSSPSGGCTPRSNGANGGGGASPGAGGFRKAPAQPQQPVALIDLTSCTAGAAPQPTVCGVYPQLVGEACPLCHSTIRPEASTAPSAEAPCRASDKAGGGTGRIQSARARYGRTVGELHKIQVLLKDLEEENATLRLRGNQLRRSNEALLKKVRQFEEKDRCLLSPRWRI